MKRTIQFLPEVFDDLRKAVFWYDNEGGKEFVVIVAVVHAARNPQFVGKLLGDREFRSAGR